MPVNSDSYLILGNGSLISTQGDGPWNRLAAKIVDQEQRLQMLRKRPAQKVDNSSGKPQVTDAGIPEQVLRVSATESPLNTIDHLHSQVSVVFTRDANDKNFAGVNIFFTGYRGNSNPVLVAQGSDSPLIFTADSTGETVTVTVVPYNGAFKMAPFAGAKATAVALDGVVSAPPAPSVASTTVAIGTTGEQFSFNFLPATLTDRILGYWIYRSSSSTAPTPPAGRFQFVPNNPNQSATYTFTDISGVTTNYYWVSAVSASGLESSLSAAGTSGGAGGGGATTTYRPSSFTTVTGTGFANPTNAYDGNSTTASARALTSGAASCSESWQGFSAAQGSPAAIKLKITSAASGSGGSGGVTYSLDGGTTYTGVRSGFWSQVTDSITLPTNQNLTQVRVKANVAVGSNRTNNASCDIYEIWIEVTT